MSKLALAVADLSPQKKRVIMIVVFILGLMQNLNSNMFGIAGTAVVSQLGGVEYYTLQFTIFTLVSGITIPLFGNLGDIQGRRIWLGIGSAIFAVGQILCFVAPTMMMILIGRVLVSVAQGVLSANYLTLIGEISNEKERPMFMSINGAGIGVAQIIAPILAGALVDSVGWRIVFMFLTIVGVVGMLCVFIAIPTIKTPYMERGEKKTPDYGGAATLGIFGLAFLLIFTWGRSKGWTSPTLIVLYIVAVLSIVLFIIIEKKGKNPLMPFGLLKYRGFTMGMIAMVAYGPAVYSFSTYTAQIGVGVMGLNSTATGTFVSVHAAGYLIFAFVWGKLVSAKGPRALKPVQLICLAGLAFSMIMFTFMTPGASAGILYFAEFIGGAFNAALIVGFTQILQREVPREYIGAGTSLLQFMMKLGGTLGLTVGGMLIGSTWSNGIGGVLSGASALGEDMVATLSSSGTLLSTPGVEALRETAVAAGNGGLFDSTLLSLRNLQSSSVSALFWFCGILLVVSIVLMCFVKGVKKNEV